MRNQRGFVPLPLLILAVIASGVLVSMLYLSKTERVKQESILPVVVSSIDPSPSPSLIVHARRMPTSSPTVIPTVLPTALPTATVIPTPIAIATPTLIPTVMPTVTPITAPHAGLFAISIKGDSGCISDTEQALQLIKDRAFSYYERIVRYVGVIECAERGSGMYAWESPPRYLVGSVTRNSGTLWYAGTIVHDAYHSELYHTYRSDHPDQVVPDHIWTGRDAEFVCLQVQAEALYQMGADQSTVDYVRNEAINTNYWEGNYEDRWW